MQLPTFRHECTLRLAPTLRQSIVNSNLPIHIGAYLPEKQSTIILGFSRLNNTVKLFDLSALDRVEALVGYQDGASSWIHYSERLQLLRDVGPDTTILETCKSDTTSMTR